MIGHFQTPLPNPGPHLCLMLELRLVELLTIAAIFLITADEDDALFTPEVIAVIPYAMEVSTM